MAEPLKHVLGLSGGIGLGLGLERPEDLDTRAGDTENTQQDFGGSVSSGHREPSSPVFLQPDKACHGHPACWRVRPKR